jgi:hypothetical protein
LVLVTVLLVLKLAPGAGAGVAVPPLLLLVLVLVPPLLLLHFCRSVQLCLHVDSGASSCLQAALSVLIISLAL